MSEEAKEYPSGLTHSQKVKLAKQGVFYDSDCEHDFPELAEYNFKKQAKPNKKGKPSGNTHSLKVNSKNKGCLMNMITAQFSKIKNYYLKKAIDIKSNNQL